MTDTKIFTLQEARAVVPWLLEATKLAESQIRAIQQQHNPETAPAEISRIILHWAETAGKLGGLPKQPFTVDFDSGSDFFCWDYPEEGIHYRHGYSEGYAGRESIKEEP